MPAVASAPRPARHASFLAFDFGTRRIGVATGNTLTSAASPLQTVTHPGTTPLDAIGKLISAWQPDALVVGVPFHPDGAAHVNTRRARRFARELASRFRLPVHEVDERYSTTEAVRRGGADVDAQAAAVILEQFLTTQASGRLDDSAAFDSADGGAPVDRDPGGVSR